jgi:site-specific DNA-methyltransferase (adenine-specific)
VIIPSIHPTGRNGVQEPGNQVLRNEDKMTREFTCEDCMDLMARYPDKHFNLAIVDPPYGAQWGNLQDITGGRKDKIFTFQRQAEKWDKKPNLDFFVELARVSNNYILFGYNYFTEFLGDSNDLIVWDKQITGNKNFLRFELIYCTFNNSDIISIPAKKENKCHPCEKPVALYKWLLSKYAKEGDLILDTHVGSASSLIACEDMGFDYVGCELDPDYYKAACERIEIFRAQGKLCFEGETNAV